MVVLARRAQATAEQPNEAAGPRGTETSLTATGTFTVGLVGGLVKFGTPFQVGIKTHCHVKTGFTGSTSFPAVAVM